MQDPPPVEARSKPSAQVMQAVAEVQVAQFMDALQGRQVPLFR
jgi:hypothetical protein